MLGHSRADYGPMGRQPVRAKCRRDVGKPRAQIEALVAERYGEPPERPSASPRKRDAQPAKPPQAATATGVKVSAAEPLDGRDPNPRDGRMTRTATGPGSDEPSDDVAIGGSKAGSKGVSSGESARREHRARAWASGRT